MGHLIRFIRPAESIRTLDEAILCQRVLSGEAVSLGIIWSKGRKRSCYRLRVDGVTTFVFLELP